MIARDPGRPSGTLDAHQHRPPRGARPRRHAAGRCAAHGHRRAGRRRTSRRSSTGPSPMRPRPAAPAPWRPSAGRASAIEGLALDDLTLLVRALGHELHLANLAEQVHRLRRRRQRDDGTPLPESIADAVAHLRDGGVSETEILRAARDDVHLELVLTAHPDRGRAPHLPAEPAAPRRAAERARRAATSPPRGAATSPARSPRRRRSCGCPTTSARSARPSTTRSGRACGSSRRASCTPRPSWPASGTATCRARRRRSRSARGSAATRTATRTPGRTTSCGRWRGRGRLLVAHYRREVRELSRALGLSVALAGRLDELAASIEADEAELPWVRDDVGVRNATEPYRRKLTAIWRAPRQRAGRPRRAGLRRRRPACSATST